MHKEKFVDLGSEKHKFVDVDPTRCIGCGICELACSLEKSERRSFNPSMSRIRIVRLYPTVNMALTCRLCQDPPCVKACPRDALMQSQENGLIIVDKDKCDGCGWCIKACDYGSIAINTKERVAVICDLCEGRKGIGVFPGRKKTSPACIEWCPEEALELVSRGRLAQKAREATVGRLFTRED